MSALHTLIEEIQNDIFAYRPEAIAQRFLQLADLLATGMQGLSSQDQAVLNPVLSAVLSGYENKDYLLLADLLEFELKPLLAVE